MPGINAMHGLYPYTAATSERPPSISLRSLFPVRALSTSLLLQVFGTKLMAVYTPFPLPARPAHTTKTLSTHLREVLHIHRLGNTSFSHI